MHARLEEAEELCGPRLHSSSASSSRACMHPQLVGCASAETWCSPMEVADAVLPRACSGVEPGGVCARSGARRQCVRAHVVEDPRGLYQRRHQRRSPRRPTAISGWGRITAVVDGVRTVLWQPPPNQHLPSSEIDRLLAARDGTLWIGTSKGLASWRDGRVTQYPETGGQKIISLLEDRNGTVWVGTLSFPPPGKLCAIDNGSVNVAAGTESGHRCDRSVQR